MSKKNLALAVDLGGSFIKSARIDSAGNILARSEIATQAKQDSQTVLERIALAVQNVYDPAASGIGVGSPGCVDYADGIVTGIDNIPSLHRINIKEFLNQRFELPVQIDNDANNAARGEFIFGAGQKSQNMLGVTLGTGVGGGLILNGKIYHGSSNYSGEIGHIIYEVGGEPCSCGRRGCLEAYASATAVLRQAHAVHAGTTASALKEFAPEKLSARTVFELAARGDRPCQDIIELAASALGRVLGGVINLLNLERVIIGGGMSAAGEEFLTMIRNATGEHALPLSFEKCQIVSGKHGNDAGVLGAAALSLGLVS